MKRVMILAAALTISMVGLSKAAISGSAHDFSSMAWSGGEICKPCHTPHNADQSGISTRLWNHQLSSATYTTMEGTGEGQDRMDRVTRLCLSCHDGTVALDSFGGFTGGSFAPGKRNLGTDLSNDHPVGYAAVYNPGITSSSGGYRYKAMSNANSGTMSVGGKSLRLAQDAAVTSSYTNNGIGPDGGAGTFFTKTWVVSCSTCHNVHNSGNYAKLLNVPNTASQLCLGCHNK